MNVKKLVSSFALTTLILASVFSVCKFMIMTSGMNFQQMMSETVMMDCMRGNQTCSFATPDHMSLFSQMYPSTAPNLTALILTLSTFAVSVFLLIFKNYIADNQRLRMKLKCLMHSLEQDFIPSVLVFAFSKGILHSKIYA